MRKAGGGVHSTVVPSCIPWSRLDEWGGIWVARRSTPYPVSKLQDIAARDGSSGTMWPYVSSLNSLTRPTLGARKRMIVFWGYNDVPIPTYITPGEQHTCLEPATLPPRRRSEMPEPRSVQERCLAWRERTALEGTCFSLPTIPLDGATSASSAVVTYHIRRH